MKIEVIEKTLYIIVLIVGSVISIQKVVKTHLEIKKPMKELKEEDK